MNDLSDPPDRLGALIDAAANMAQILQDLRDDTLVTFGEIEVALDAWESAYAAISPDVSDAE
jgi:hypothetical protein